MQADDQSTTAEAMASGDERDNWMTLRWNGTMKKIHRVQSMYDIHFNGVVIINNNNETLRGVSRCKLSDLGQMVELMSRDGGSDGLDAPLDGDNVESGDVEEEGRSTPPANSFKTAASDVGEVLSGGTDEGMLVKIKRIGRWSWPQDYAESNASEKGFFVKRINLYDTVATETDEALFSGTDEGATSDVDVVGGVDGDEEQTAGEPANCPGVYCEDCEGFRDEVKAKSDEVKNVKDECENCAPKPGCVPGICTVM